MLIHPLPPKYEIYPSFSPSSITLWVLLMAPTSSAMHLLQTVMQQGTARAYSLKTALLHVPLIFVSCIFYLVGRDQWQTLHFSIRPVKVTSTSQGGGITLQMLALPCWMCCWSSIAVCGTIYLNGIMPRKHKWYVFSQKFLTNILPSPCNPQELFNLHHASACNVIEWIFGILKQCF